MAWLLLGSVILLWGINWPVMKLGLADIPPMTFAVIRMLLGAVCMFGVLAVRGNRIRLPSRHDLPIVLTVGLLQMGAFLGLVTVALQFVSAGRVGWAGGCGCRAQPGRRTCRRLPAACG